MLLLCERNGRWRTTALLRAATSNPCIEGHASLSRPYAVGRRLVLRKGNLISLVLSFISPCTTCNLVQNQALPTARTDRHGDTVTETTTK